MTNGTYQGIVDEPDEVTAPQQAPFGGPPSPPAGGPISGVPPAGAYQGVQPEPWRAGPFEALQYTPFQRDISRWPELLTRYGTEIGAQVAGAPFSAAEFPIAAAVNLANWGARQFGQPEPMPGGMKYGPEIVQERVVEPALQYLAGGTGANYGPAEEPFVRVGAGAAENVAATLTGQRIMGGAFNEPGAYAQALREGIIAGGTGALAAGMAEQGYSPEAQMAAAFGLHSLTAAAPGAARAVDPQRVQQVEDLRAAGVPVSPTETAAGPGRLVGRVLENLPLSGQTFAKDWQFKKWSDTVANTFGGQSDSYGNISETPQFRGGTSPVAEANTRINTLYNSARSGSPISVDTTAYPGAQGNTTLLNELSRIDNSASGTTWGKPVQDYIHGLLSDAATNNGQLNAGYLVDQVKATGHLSSQIENYSRGTNVDYRTRDALRDVQTQLNAALRNASLTPDQVQDLDTASRYYKNLQVVKDATDVTTGKYSLEDLKQAVNKNRDWLGPGGGELGNAVRMGQGIITEPGAPRPIVKAATSLGVVGKVVGAEALAHHVLNAPASPEMYALALGAPVAGLFNRWTGAGTNVQPVTLGQYVGRPLFAPPMSFTPYAR